MGRPPGEPTTNTKGRSDRAISFSSLPGNCAVTFLSTRPFEKCRSFFFFFSNWTSLSLKFWVVFLFPPPKKKCTHMQLDRWECVFQCNCFVSVRIYIVPLSIVCMHNLKGKCVRLFVLWSDTLITASFILSKVLFCIFLMKFFFFFLLIACTVFKGRMLVHSKGKRLSVEQKALKGKPYPQTGRVPLKAGVLFSNPTQPFWSWAEWRTEPMPW